MTVNMINRTTSVSTSGRLYEVVPGGLCRLKACHRYARKLNFWKVKHAQLSLLQLLGGVGG